MAQATSAQTRPRILLTHVPDMRRNYFGDRALAALSAVGEVAMHEGSLPLDPAALARAAAGCRIIVADRNTPLPAPVFPRLPSVAAVLRVAVDIRNIDVAAASAEGILVCHASRTWVPAVAELVLGLMVDVARGISSANVAYKAGRAPEIRIGRQLNGATAGIIGYGPLGRYVVRLCQALGMRVLVCDPYVRAEVADARQVELRQLLAEADFVLPLAVATEETENLIGEAELCSMKPSAVLVNLSRGNLVDEKALERALDEGRIAGAAMDVGRAADQMPSLALAARADVAATPHIGGLTQEAIEGQAMETVAQAATIIAGHMPDGAVNGAEARRVTQAA